MSFCPNCGKAYEGSPRFCPDCGTALAPVVAPESKTRPAVAAEPSVRHSHGKRNAAVLLVIILLLTAGLVGYSYTQLTGQITSVGFGGIHFNQPSATLAIELGVDLLSGNYIAAGLSLVNSIQLNINIGLTNNGFLPVYIPDETHTLMINGITVGSGSATVDSTVTPGQTVTVPVEQNVLTSSFSGLASSIAANGGNLDVQVNGEAHFSLFGIPIPVPVPFHVEKQISIVQEVENYVKSVVSGQSSQSGSTQISNSNPGQGGVIVSGTYNVGPGHYTSFGFTLGSATTVSGTFSATATLGNDIIVYVFDQAQFNQYQGSQTTSAYYNSGKVASGTIDINLGPGTYYLVLDNTYSTFSTKDVTIQVSTS